MEICPRTANFSTIQGRLASEMVAPHNETLCSSRSYMPKSRFVISFVTSLHNSLLFQVRRGLGVNGVVNFSPGSFASLS